MTEERDITPAGRKWMAAVFVFFGMYMLAMAFGWVRIKPGSLHAPLWVVGSAGMMFHLAGAMIYLNGREKGGALNSLVTWMFLLALALPFNWVAFGEGERHFSSAVGGFGMSMSGAGNEGTGRLLFGIFAVAMDCMLVWPLVRLLRGKTAFDSQKAS